MRKARGGTASERKVRRRVSPPLDPAMAAKIKRMLRDTDLAQHQIAAQLGVNQGRVSEVSTGQKYPDVPPES